MEYTTYIPKAFYTEAGKKYILNSLNLNEISKKPLFENWVPEEKVNDIKNYLIKTGFTKPEIAIPEGEIFGLSKLIDNMWELHIRVFNQGIVQSHIEINRKYFQHLGNTRIFTAYEAYNFYKGAFSKLYLKYVPENTFIKNVTGNFKISLPAPSGLTPWKPVIAVAGIAAILGSTFYYLSKNKK